MPDKTLIMLGDQIGRCFHALHDPKRAVTQIVLPPALARQVAQGILHAAPTKQKKRLVKPQSVIAPHERHTSTPARLV